MKVMIECVACSLKMSTCQRSQSSRQSERGHCTSMSSSVPGENDITLMPKYLVHGLQAGLQAGSALRLRQCLVLQLPECVVALLHKHVLCVAAGHLKLV